MTKNTVPTLTYLEYLTKVVEYQSEDLDQRWGQCMFNVLCIERPEFAEEIRGTLQDPYHEEVGPRLAEIYKYIEENW